MKKLILCLALLIVAAAPAQAIFTGTYEIDYTNKKLTLFENWSDNAAGGWEMNAFDLFDMSESWTICKVATNNTGVAWTRFANEILDQAGDPNDAFDQANEPWVDVLNGTYSLNASHSNDNDALSFDQGGSIPRTSDVFASVYADELGTRDFLDFYTGVVNPGETVTMSFGYWNGTDQEAYLVQRPNEYSVVPEPGTIALLGIGLAGVAARRRRNRKS